MSTNERELQLIKKYLNQHFAPISRLLHEGIRDPEIRLIALRRTTRHIYHWAQDEGIAFSEPEEIVTVAPPSNGHGNGASVEKTTTPPDERPPDEWVSGGEPATPGQLSFLRDRGVATPAGITKAEASKLITSRIYGNGAGARA